MCGRFTIMTDYDTLSGWFDFEAVDLRLGPRYNVAPSQQVLVVTNDGQRNRAELMRWGLIPYWAKDPSIGNRMINARAETVAEKPSFRKALQGRRCLVIADSFYEWKKQGRGKIPMRAVLKSREPFAFAGLWDEWRSPSGEVIRSCTIITTEANALIAPIHDRMPVMLPKEAEAVWLDPTVEDPMFLTALLKPYPADAMEVYAVSSLVNSPTNDSPACVARAEML